VPKKTGTIHIKWIRSGIGFPRKQKAVVKSIGLHRLNQIVERPDTAHFRGLVAKVPHLVAVVQLPQSAAWVNTPEYNIVPAEASPKAPAPPVKKAAVETPAEPVAAPEKKVSAPRKKPAIAKSADTASSAKKASVSTEKPKRKAAAPKSAAKEESKSKKGKK
jgi:large subunit ribosomal protein L30